MRTRPNANEVATIPAEADMPVPRIGSGWWNLPNVRVATPQAKYTSTAVPKSSAAIFFDDAEFAAMVVPP